MVEALKSVRRGRPAGGQAAAQQVNRCVSYSPPTIGGALEPFTACPCVRLVSAGQVDDNSPLIAARRHHRDQAINLVPTKGVEHHIRHGLACGRSILPLPPSRRDDRLPGMPAVEGASWPVSGDATDGHSRQEGLILSLTLSSPPARRLRALPTFRRTTEDARSRHVAVCLLELSTWRSFVHRANCLVTSLGVGGLPLDSAKLGL